MKTFSFPLLIMYGLELAWSTNARSQSYTWSTIAGSPGFIGYADGPGQNAGFFQPYAITSDSASNLYVADALNDTIRKLTPSGNNWFVSTLAGNALAGGFADGTNDAALFFHPAGITVDSAGRLYVADFYNHAIRKVAPVGPNWVVTTLAGNGTSGIADGTGAAARFNHPTGVALDNAGNIYVADEGNHTIRKLVPSGTNWVVTTIAGRAGFSGRTDGTNTNARFSSPWGIAAGAGPTLYVSDFGSSLIRKVTLAGTNWLVTTIAGGATPGSADGTNSGALFDYPMGLALDTGGALYVADFLDDTIRKLAPAGTNWVSSTIGGTAGESGSADGLGGEAQFYGPRGVAADIGGNVYVADTMNHTIRLGQPALLLKISVAGNQLILTCPSPAVNFVLQTTSTLTPASWVPVTSGVTISGNNFILTRNLSAPPAFYRLRK